MNNTLKILALLFISTYCFAQPQASLWWVEGAVGQAITKHNHHAEGPLQLACGANVYIEVDDHTAGAYDVVYHILNEGDQNLVISNIGFTDNDSEFSLNIYDQTFPITVAPNQELEFIVVYNTPEVYHESTAALSIESNDPNLEQCSLHLETGAVFSVCFNPVGSSGSPLDTNVVGTRAHVEAEYMSWFEDLPCAFDGNFILDDTSANILADDTEFSILPPGCNGFLSVQYNCCLCPSIDIAFKESNKDLKSMEEDCSANCNSILFAGTTGDDVAFRFEDPCSFVGINVTANGTLALNNVFIGGCNSCATFSYTIIDEDPCMPFFADITDPCSCDNPNNQVCPDGGILLADVIEVEFFGLTEIDLVTLGSYLSGQLYNSDGTVLEPGTPFTQVECSGHGVLLTTKGTANSVIGPYLLSGTCYELEIYSKDNSPATITVNLNGDVVNFLTAGTDFTTDACTCPVDVAISDPCACDNPDNVTVGGDLLFHDILEVTTTPGSTVRLDVNDGNLYDATGALVADGLMGQVFNEVSMGVFHLEVYTKASTPANIEVSVNGVTTFPMDTDKFTTEACSPCVAVPTMGEWGLMCLGLILLILGVVTIKERRFALD